MSFNKLIQHIKSLFIPQLPIIIGKIKFYDKKKRFGFIVADKYEFFFHAQNTKSSDINDLADEMEVKFIVTQGKKGLQADKVERIRKPK